MELETNYAILKEQYDVLKQHKEENESEYESKLSHLKQETNDYSESFRSQREDQED